MFIIPDEVLSTLICSICDRYLSVKPVKIYERGIIKCGRCSRNTDNGVISVYGNIIKHGLFPCINRFQGCKQLLTYEEVSNHEKECVSIMYNCPECPASTTKYTAYHLILHYKSAHPSKVLKKAEVCVDQEQEFEKHFMFKDGDFIFILYIRCNIQDKCFYINASNLGPSERISQIIQFVKCYVGASKNNKLFFQTNRRKCTSCDNNSESFKISFPKTFEDITFKFCFDRSAVNNFYIFSNNSIIQVDKLSNKKTTNTEMGLHNEYPKIYLSKPYTEQHPSHYLSTCGTKLLIQTGNTIRVFPRICSFCENIFPVSKSIELYTCQCDLNHVFCVICMNIGTVCSNKPYSVLKYSGYYTDIYRQLYFFCKWNCRRFYCGTDLRFHEDHCKQNKFTPLSLNDVVLNYFNSYSKSNKNHIVSTSNVFSFRDYNFETCPKVFVITRDHFKFILHTSCENSTYNFWVSHDYPLDKYYILFKIKDDFDYCRVNAFSINNLKIFRGFTVLLRKV